MFRYTRMKAVKGALPWKKMDERLVELHVEFFGECVK